MLELLKEPWPWYIGGPLIGLVMILLILLGKSFGFSSNFRTMCAVLGAGKSCDFFAFDWKSQRWNLLFLLGSFIGGFVAYHFLSDNQVPAISANAVEQIKTLGFHSVDNSYYPTEFFDVLSLKNILILFAGGLLIGFGTRYAGGCTSGHAISGLSNLQLPSLIAVIGFFAGGLIMAHFILPLIF
ncbi:MAG: YeeE/YedE thiosulfate transporter family protein [Bacteroidota bacterium]|nr:YeeE/YedE thiosulfate transporter family protein [Bacteroidota bacterium]